MIIDILDEMFPDAHCELEYKNAYELIVAVCLSAQTTDIRVNHVTKKLFQKYPTIETLCKADLSEVEDIIKSLGLYHNKARNIIKLSQEIMTRFNGVIPSSREELMTLSGVGRKTANVVLSCAFNIPAVAVDTHVNRVAKRLNIAHETDSLLEVEEKIMAFFPKEKWGKIHHQLLFLGRYVCKAQNPQCEKCLFKEHRQ